MIHRTLKERYHKSVNSLAVRLVFGKTVSRNQTYKFFVYDLEHYLPKSISGNNRDRAFHYVSGQVSFPPTTLLRLALRRLSSEVAGRFRRTDKIVRAPGWTLLNVLSWVYSKKTMNGVFRPAIVDMQHEHVAALADGKRGLARWVQLRGYCSVGAAALGQLPVSLIKLAVKLWKAAS